MAAKVSFNDKQNFVENPTIPAEQKIGAGDMNELKKAVNDNATILEGKSAVLLDEVVQEQITKTKDYIGRVTTSLGDAVELLDPSTILIDLSSFGTNYINALNQANILIVNNKKCIKLSHLLEEYPVGYE